MQIDRNVFNKPGPLNLHHSTLPEFTQPDFPCKSKSGTTLRRSSVRVNSAAGSIFVHQYTISLSLYNKQ